MKRLNKEQLNVLPEFMTIPEAAKALGLKVHSLRRAVKSGLVPSYACFNSRILVRPAEILAILAKMAEGRV